MEQKKTSFSAISTQQTSGVFLVKIREHRIFEGSAVETLRSELEQAIGVPAGQRVVLDFSAVELMSSETLGLLITLYRDLAESGGRIVLCGVQEPLLKVFTLTRLDRLFRIAPTSEEAIRVAVAEGSSQA